MLGSAGKKVVLVTTEERVVQTCQSAMAIVSDAVRSLQTIALDVRDVVVEVEQVLATVEAEERDSRRVQLLQLALDQGKAIVNQLTVIGAYDPVPIELL